MSKTREALVLIDGGMHRVTVPRYIGFVADSGNWCVLRVVRPAALATMVAEGNAAYPDLPAGPDRVALRFLPQLLEEETLEMVGSFPLGEV